MKKFVALISLISLTTLTPSADAQCLFSSCGMNLQNNWSVCYDRWGGSHFCRPTRTLFFSVRNETDGKLQIELPKKKKRGVLRKGERKTFRVQLGVGDGNISYLSFFSQDGRMVRVPVSETGGVTDYDIVVVKGTGGNLIPLTPTRMDPVERGRFR